MQKVIYSSDPKIKIHHNKGGDDHPWAVVLTAKRLIQDRAIVLAWCSTREKAREVARSIKKVI